MICLLKKSRSVICLWSNIRWQIHPRRSIVFRVDATELAEWAFKTTLYYDLGLAELFGEAAKNIICRDTFMLQKILLHKSTDWKHEQEWRLIFSNKSPANMQQGHPCAKKKPAALYLGRNISEPHEKLLRHIAGEKEIPVYKMEIDHHQRDYKLNPVPISTWNTTSQREI